MKKISNKSYAWSVFEYKSNWTYLLFYNGQIEMHCQNTWQILIEGSELISIDKYNAIEKIFKAIEDEIEKSNFSKIQTFLKIF